MTFRVSVHVERDDEEVSVTIEGGRALAQFGDPDVATCETVARASAAVQVLYGGQP